MGMAGAGIALGIAIALLKGLVLNQTVGRPLQLRRSCTFSDAFDPVQEWTLRLAS